MAPLNGPMKLVGNFVSNPTVVPPDAKRSNLAVAGVSRNRGRGRGQNHSQTARGRLAGMPETGPAAVTLGYPEFWPKAYAEFERFFVAVLRLQDALNGLTSAARDPIEPYQRVILNLGLLSGVSMIEVVTLAGNGLGHGAMKIVRGMLEYGINAEYLRRNPETCDDYMLWHWVEQWKLAQYLKDNAPNMYAELDATAVARTEEEYHACEARFRLNPDRAKLRGDWCSLNLADRATRTDFQEAYKLVYPLGSKLMHGTMGALGMHFKPEEDEDRIAIPPSLEWCGHALIGGHLCVLRMVDTLRQTFNDEPQPSFDELASDFAGAWNK